MSIARFYFVACSLCCIRAGTLASSFSPLDFNYNNGGEDWMVGECASRDRQSPIDFGNDAPWSCNPPLPAALYALLLPTDLVRLGFVEPSPVDPGFTVPYASFLQTDDSEKNGFLPKVFWLPTAPPALMFPGCMGPLGAFFFRYDLIDKPLTIMNNGHSIATDMKGHGLGSLVLEDTIYDVLSINFHVWSEHRFNGARKPLELHIVHRDPNTNRLVIVAVPFDTTPSMPASEMSLLQTNRSRRLRKNSASRRVISNSAPTAPNPAEPGFSDALANLVTFPLPVMNQEMQVPIRAGPVDVIGPLLRGAGSMPQGFFQYGGSLTAPPCTEQVTWLVRKEPLIASRSQVEVLRQAIMEANSNFPNSRSVMPVMGRNILYRLGIHGDAPAPAPMMSTPYPQPVIEPHVDFRGITEGKAAYHEAVVVQNAKEAITGAIKQAQEAAMNTQHAVDPSIAASVAEQVDFRIKDMAATLLPTPNPEAILHRMVNVVADQLEGPERASAIAAANAGIGVR